MSWTTTLAKYWSTRSGPVSSEDGWRFDGSRDVYPLADDDIAGPIGIGGVLRWFDEPRHVERASNHLRRYFGDVSEGALYAGQYFERFALRSDPTAFTPWDVLAVESLSVSVPSSTAHWLLGPDRPRDELMTACVELYRSGGQRLWSSGFDPVDAGTPFSRLYALLRTQPGLGPVVTSKLMASKFPDLVPIRDSRVEKLLDLEKSREWWAPIRGLFSEGLQNLHALLNRLPLPSGAPEVGVLRRLDVILWMEARSRNL